jgi:protein involved in polysaccharide export with SLBB domain
MRRISLVLVLLTIAVAALAQPLSSAQTIEPDDEIAILVVEDKAFGGEFVVLRDGSVNGRFGRVIVGGKTVAEAERLIANALSKILLRATVSITITKPRPRTVYLVGIKAVRGGAIAHRAGLDLRAIFSEVDEPENLDRLAASVYRGGEKVFETPLSDVFRGAAKSNILLEPEDVVTVAPRDSIRIWVVGQVSRPGEIRMSGDATVYQAIAEAGGIVYNTGSFVGRPPSDEDIIITVRRGAELRRIPTRSDEASEPFQLEAGDTISVLSVPTIRVTVSGEVRIPGEYVIRSNVGVEAAVAAAAGLTGPGMMSDIVVIRRGEAFRIDATSVAAGTAGTRFGLEDGDLVFVPKSERFVIALGPVAKPGRIYLDDGKQYRLADVLAQAGGLAGGTLRRVVVGRPGKDGKYEPKFYDLDRYIRDGVVEHNPIIVPGDVILFSQPTGVTARNLGEIISSAVLLQTLINR